MPKKASITKEQIFETALDITHREGLRALSVRRIAAALNISVGSIYNHYETKGELFADIIASFWKDALPHATMAPRPEESFVDYTERLYDALSVVCADYRRLWLGQISSLDTQDLSAARQQEQRMFAHIERALQVCFERDSSIDISSLCPQASPEEFCHWVWSVLINDLKSNTPKNANSYILFALLRRVCITD